MEIFISWKFCKKKIVNRTKDDNNENEFTGEVFKNRKGGLHNIPDLYDDKQPEYEKFPVKPKDGTRKFKGSETIRRLKEDTDD